MADKKEMTAQAASVGADAGQSLTNCSTTIIPESREEFNGESTFPKDFSEQVFDIGNPRFLPVISMPELYSTTYESKPAVIEGLLCVGTYLFAGAPKLGKSFLMLQLGYHVSTGTPLWGYPVRQGSVLYLALEDDYPRLQGRLYRMFGTDAADGLYLSTWAKQIGSGLEEQLEGFVAQHPDARLIIIDTLQRIRPAGSDRYSYASDYDIIAKLTTLAAKLNICLLIVHHTRKQQAEDKFDMISGTNGLLGAADGAFLLQKEKRTDNTATLDISGRDQQDQRLYLTRDLVRLVWNLERKETDLWREPPDPLLEAVAALVTESNPEWNGTPTELVSALALEIKPNVLTMRLNVTASRLSNEYGIRYESSRNHAGRRITLTLQDAGA